MSFFLCIDALDDLLLRLLSCIYLVFENGSRASYPLFPCVAIAILPASALASWWSHHWPLGLWTRVLVARRCYLHYACWFHCSPNRLTRVVKTRYVLSHPTLVCTSINVVILLPLCDFVLLALIFVLGSSFLAFNCDSFLTFYGVRAVARCVPCPADGYCISNGVSENGPRMLSTANDARWIFCPWHQ